MTVIPSWRSSRWRGVLVSLSTCALLSAASALPALDLSISPSSHDFATVQVNQSSTQQFQLSYTGSGNGVQLAGINALGHPTTLIDTSGNTTTLINALGTTTTGGDLFQLLDDNCAQQFLSDTCQFSVQFNPQQAGQYQSGFNVEYALATTTSSGQLSVSLSAIGALANPGTGTDKLALSSETIDFGTVALNSSAPAQTLEITNSSTEDLQLGELALSGDSDFSIEDSCSGQTLAPNGVCQVLLGFSPSSAGGRSAALNIPLAGTQTGARVQLIGEGAAWCDGQYQNQLLVYPQELDFGEEIVGASQTIRVHVNSWVAGCDALRLGEISLAGADQAEFSISRQRCFHGVWRQESYSYCMLELSFKPSSAGTKDASLQVNYETAGVAGSSLPITATALAAGQPAFSVDPEAVDFGDVRLRFADTERKEIVITNNGSSNLRFKRASFWISGANGDEFKVNAWQCRRGVLKPGRSCSVYVSIAPDSEGAKQAQLNIAAKNSNVAVEVPLSANVLAPANCDAANITIMSTGAGELWAEKQGSAYTGATDTWLRVGDDSGTAAVPNENDVVLIKAGHSVKGIPSATVRALCVEEGGQLLSWDTQGTPLEIIASDYIENKGTIRGQDGAWENSSANCERSQVGRGDCAHPGASVMLKVGGRVRSYSKAGDTWWHAYQSGGPLLNTGTIRAGDGGAGQRYGADGGQAIVLARGLTNKLLVQGGNGGDILGTEAGRAGRGGVAQLWGKLGGSGHLYNSNGARAIAGNGGDCNPTASGVQIGGRGGNLWLVSLPNVHLRNGIMKAGKGGIGCKEQGGKNGRRGWVRIEPNLIDLSGANTRIEGDNITIYGGADWNLDLSDTSSQLFSADGDITLSVGEGGSIDFSGAANDILQAGGKIYVFADNIILDEGRELSDMLQAAGGIVVSPAKLLYQAELSGPSALNGEPGDTLTLNFSLSNNGSQADTYQLLVSNTAGWSMIHQLPSSLELASLESVDLTLDISLPTGVDAVSNIQIRALSQGDSTVSSLLDIPVQVSANLDAQALGLCPTEGVVDGQCSNHGQVMRSTTLSSSAEVEGGELSGDITSAGLVTGGVSIRANTVLRGGKLSGHVSNLGLLENVEISDGQVNGGRLGGSIRTSGLRAVFKDVELVAGADLSGGSLEGDIKGADGSARISNVQVASGALLRNLVIGSGVVLADNSSLGEGVRFENLEDVPLALDLLSLLPALASDEVLDKIGYPSRKNLLQDLLVNGGDLLDLINSLPVIQEAGLQISQDENTGYLRINLNGEQVNLHPVQMQRSSDTSGSGLEVLEQNHYRLHFGAGVSLDLSPALQMPKLFEQGLSNVFGMNINMDTQGQFKVSVDFGSIAAQEWFHGRADLLSGAVDAADEASSDHWLFRMSTVQGDIGLQVRPTPYQFGQTLVLVFIDEAGERREQVIHPVLKDEDALRAAAPDLSILEYGMIRFTLNGVSYEGMLDYRVDAQQLAKVDMSIETIADVDGNGLEDYVLVFPDGSRQILYQRP